MTNEEAIKLVDDRMCYGRGKWSKHHQPVIDEYWQAGEMAIKALEAEPHWIPVTERLPEESGQYLITVKYEHVDGYEDIYAEHGDWSDGKWDMFSFGHCGKVEDIVAWMPLPEPFKEVTE